MATGKKKKFQVNDMIVGLERGEHDKDLLHYMGFISLLLSPRSVGLVHVVPMDSNPIGVSYPEVPLALTDSYSEKLVKEIDKSAAPHFNIRGVESEYILRVGAPLEEIVATANERSSDLVAIGKRRGTTFHNVLVKNMIRQLTANILMVPEGADKKLETLFVPVDFSTNSVRALRTALAIKDQAELDLRILAVNVYQRPDLMAFNLSMGSDEFEKHVDANHREGFAEFVSEHFPGREDEIEPLLIQEEDPDIAYVLFEKAKEVDADLILMGARGLSRLAVLLLGSTTETLLNLNYAIPTLIVK